jgi:hypothetical protein
MATQEDTVKALLDLHGQTYAEELGIKLRRPSPSGLFRLLCAATLFSARIDAEVAAEAARNLSRRGWRTAEAMADSKWEERVDALHEAGYTRYQERSATMLGEMSEHLLERWDGDLRALREEAEREPRTERKLLKEAKGLGDVGVDIFFREVQVGWEEILPFADKRSLEPADRLRLPKDPDKLLDLAGGPTTFTRLVAALIRTGLADDQDAVRKAARER